MVKSLVSAVIIGALAMALAAPVRAGGSPTATERWSAERAHAWYDAQPWLVGANYNPASAINQLEMWQADTFDPERIDLELGWAADIGMNSMRVYLHNLVWEADADGLKERMRTFLEIADSHGISTMFVLFDSVWDPDPVPGPQRDPAPGIHNSGWVQAPGAERLADKSRYHLLEAYVKDIVGTFGDDPRVIVWDVWNEPSNGGGGNYEPTEHKEKYVAKLLARTFKWARAANPSQPLTSGVWIGDEWSDLSALPEIEQIQLTESDIISFHDYSWPEVFERRVKQLQVYGRPLLCTEYMARGNGSTFDNTLPLGKEYDVAMYNWGLVDGKTQTRLPWDSWQVPYIDREPWIWFHEVFHYDGRPYRQHEVDLIRRLTGRPAATQ